MGRVTGTFSTDAVSSATQNKRVVLEPLLRRIMPQAMADGMVKVAIVRNLTGGDYGRQFLESCINEGRSMGFIVDSFVLSGENEQNKNKILQIAGADYDGIIFSLVGEGISYNDLLPHIDRKIKIVTFDNLPYKDDDLRKDALYGVTSAAQDDRGLAEISLSAMIESFASVMEPVRVISVIANPGIPLLDNRYDVYNRFISEGKIVEVAGIRPAGFDHIRSSIRETLIKTLADFPVGSFDAIWAPYDEFAKGCFDALNEAGRNEILLTSIDISNDNIKLMLDNADQWIATAATDPSVAGIIIMRILAAKLAGEETPSAYTFKAQLIKSSMLNQTITMANITSHIPGWLSSHGVFEFPWMIELKNCVAGRR